MSDQQEENNINTDAQQDQGDQQDNQGQQEQEQIVQQEQQGQDGIGEQPNIVEQPEQQGEEQINNQEQLQQQQQEEEELQRKQEESKKQQQLEKQKQEEDAKKKKKKKKDEENDSDQDKPGNKKKTETKTQEDVPQQEEIKKIEENFYYPIDHVEKEIEDTPITRKVIDFHENFGFDSFKRQNVSLLDEEHMIYASGVIFNILNIVTKENEVFFSRDGGGIGSIAVHPKKTHFAVAEKGTYPNIYIYEYPSKRLYRIMRKGTERSYSSVTFSHNGENLASVGSSPDYTIAIWDWKQEVILLKAKAFSQEVFNVTFSKYSEFILGTSGMGHIKFWKVAETFTGLKLKGMIGKFGQVEISDVESYYIFSDGKYLSSTEYGKLLLWEGNLIKCVISGKYKDINQDKCHDGAINVVFRKDDDIVTAGKDGYIRFWDYQTIMDAEGDDFGNFYIEPNAEIKLYSDEDQQLPAEIMHIVVAGNFWLVQDGRGNIRRLEIEANKQDHRHQVIIEMNKGQINDLISSPIGWNGLVSVGQDGYVRLWDYVGQSEYYRRQFGGKGTCAEWLPFNRKNQGRVIVTGFETGVVRFLLLKQEKFFLLNAVKVHKDGIRFLRVSSDGSILCVVSVVGDIFFIKLSQTDLQLLEPFCFWETGHKINDIQWDKQGEKILLACQDGSIYEYQVPKFSECDFSETYLRKCVPSNKYTIKMMEFQKPKAEEMDLTYLLKHKNEERKEEEWEPASIINATYFDSACTKVILSSEGKYTGYLYLVDWNQDRPLEAFIAPKVNTTYMKMVDYGDLLMIGFQDGSWQLRHRFNFRSWLGKGTHDRDIGKIRRVIVNSENNVIASGAEDGTIFVYKIDMASFKSLSRGDFIDTFGAQQLQLSNGINEGTFSDEIEISNNAEEDIIDASIYSIQQAKLLAEEDYRKKEAEKKKNLVREKIRALVREFEEAKSRNHEIDEIARLTNQEMTVDQEYIHMLQQRVEEDLEETRLEVKWDEEYYKLQFKKLQDYVKNELEVDTFIVKAIKDPKIFVSTFKVKKMSQFVQSNLEQILKTLEEDNKNLEGNSNNILANQNFAKTNTKTMNLDNKNNPLGTSQNQEGLKQFEYKTNEKGEIELENGEKLSGVKAERYKQKLQEARIKQQMDELERKKPTKESFEPESIRDIQLAQATLGDYKLKSSDKYDVAESQRMNVSKKRKHMFLLEDFIYNTKMKFNNSIIELRNAKKSIIDKVKNYNEKITQINKELEIHENLFVPQIDWDTEYPEKKLEVKSEEIEEALIQKAKAEQAQKKTKGGAAQAQEEVQESAQKSKENQVTVETKKEKKVHTSFKQRKGIKVQHSELEDQMKEIKKMRLQAEKQRMLDEMTEEIESFDLKVQEFRSEKNLLESDMTVAQMKFITYYQELLVLIDMEDHDNKLIGNLLNYKAERAKFQQERDKIEQDLADLIQRDSQAEKELKENMNMFKDLVFPDDEHKREKIHQYYTKRFKKEKAKKLKLKNQEEEGEDGEDGDGGSDEEDDDDFLDDDDDDDDEKLDISPVENDTKTHEIMTKINELEDNMETYRKEKVDLERQKVQVGARTEKVLKDLRRADDELKDYQRKKLKRVNQLDVSYTLHLDQIVNLQESIDDTNNLQYNSRLSGGSGQDNISYLLPETLDKSILFTRGEYLRLNQRIKELAKESKAIRKEKFKLEREKNKLAKTIGELQKKTAELTAKHNEKHILKFGDVIDLKILDALQPTKQVLEMRQKFKEEEKTAIKRIQKAQQSLQEKKLILLETKKKNTEIIKKITELGEKQMDLNKKLDSTNKQLYKVETDDKKQKDEMEREKQNLKDLVRFLSSEIKDLKTEISLFKKKGGHIYTMVTSNKKTFN